MAESLNSNALRPQTRSGLPLGELLASVPGLTSMGLLDSADAMVSIHGVASDSRLVGPGDLYLALPGTHTHGAVFVDRAIAAGAAAVLTDRRGRELLGSSAGGASPASRLPIVVVADPRGVMAALAQAVYGRPADALTMMGITGTNGKTTTSYLLDAGLRAAGRHTGLIGTLGFAVDQRPLDGPRTTVTTPESAELHGLLAAMREHGADAVTMEVSSHALATGRVDAITFDVVAFTNFGRDHLDFHGSEEAYFAAKASLFTADRARAAVINVDDPRGADLVGQAEAEGLTVRTTSLRTDPGSGSGADYAPTWIRPLADRTELGVRTPERTLDLSIALPGSYNTHNAITALAMIDLLGLDLRAAGTGLATVVVPGRMQRIELGAGSPVAYVDFAHTPQAVRAALAALREQAGAARLVCVVGCGGDRDAVKRRPMGAAAAAGADLVIITDDNPRTEEPASIRAEALAGAQEQITATGSAVEAIDGGDRAGAIRIALERVGRQPGSVVAVLGKGHEQGQEIAGEMFPFDDAATLRSTWAELTGVRA